MNEFALIPPNAPAIDTPNCLPGGANDLPGGTNAPYAGMPEQTNSQGGLAAYIISGSAPCGRSLAPLDSLYDSVEDYITDHPKQTLFLRANGSSMSDAGIDPGDVLAVDCKQEPEPGDIALICLYNNEYTIKRWRPPYIIGETGGARQPMLITPEMNATALGVVCSIIRRIG